MISAERAIALEINKQPAHRPTGRMIGMDAQSCAVMQSFLLRLSTPPPSTILELIDSEPIGHKAEEAALETVER